MQSPEKTHVKGSAVVSHEQLPEASKRARKLPTTPGRRAAEQLLPPAASLTSPSWNELTPLVVPVAIEPSREPETKIAPVTVSTASELAWSWEVSVKGFKKLDHFISTLPY